MHYLWWTLTSLLMALGLAGTVLPFIPGTSIILAGAVLYHFLVQPIGWWNIAGIAGLTAASYVVDLLSSTIGARWAGATKWGALGGIIGTVVGLYAARLSAPASPA